jgi:hypothetical protein
MTIGASNFQNLALGGVDHGPSLKNHRHTCKNIFLEEKAQK